MIKPVPPFPGQASRQGSSDLWRAGAPCGSGHLLRVVLDAVPEARGVLFDLPHVIAEAQALTRSGFSFAREIETGADISILEALPA